MTTGATGAVAGVAIGKDSDAIDPAAGLVAAVPVGVAVALRAALAARSGRAAAMGDLREDLPVATCRPLGPGGWLPVLPVETSAAAIVPVREGADRAAQVLLVADAVLAVAVPAQDVDPGVGSRAVRAPAQGARAAVADAAQAGAALVREALVRAALARVGLAVLPVLRKGLVPVNAAVLEHSCAVPRAAVAGARPVVSVPARLDREVRAMEEAVVAEVPPMAVGRAVPGRVALGRGPAQAEIGARVAVPAVPSAIQRAGRSVRKMCGAFAPR